MSKALTAIKVVRDRIVNASTDAGSQVFTDVAQQNISYPHVILSIISREESPTQDSGSAVDTYRIQVDVYAKASSSASGQETAHTIADEIRTALSRYTDTSGYTHDIDSIQEANYFTDFIPEIDVSRVTNDYLIRVK